MPAGLVVEMSMNGVLVGEGGGGEVEAAPGNNIQAEKNLGRERGGGEGFFFLGFSFGDKR